MAERANTSCPACSSESLQLFHSQDSVPVNSCLLLTSRDEATSFPRGVISLAFCETCGFITNRAFDPELAEYSQRYEETQAFSPRFTDFARDLAKSWVDRYQLAGRSVIEIGCGKGEFLVMMAEAGIARGVGIDPGVNPVRISADTTAHLEWRREFFDSAFGPLEADAVVCRHTLEHIHPVAEFLTTLRRSIGDRHQTVVLFELPDVRRVLEETAFWDVYYEHCSYFSAGSLVRLFERCGFEVVDVRRAYDDQYLLLEAFPAARRSGRSLEVDDIADLGRGVAHFQAAYRELVERWRERLAAVTARGGRVVIWGAGSKGVAFLSVVGEHVVAAVDINPYKHGMYMAGTGHSIIAPERLSEIEPELIVVMNPIYTEEISGDLRRLGVEADLMSL